MGVCGLEGREKEKEIGYWTGMELPKELYALHHDEAHRELYHDREEHAWAYDRGKEENYFQR